jgi:uncharacterized protein (TIGR02145 family)
MNKKQTNFRTLLILALVVLLGSNQNIAQNVGIGSTSFTPDASAGLEIRYTDKGFLLPRMTTEQRDDIQNPATGLQIFNLSTSCLEIFANGIWQQIFCAVCPIPNVPTAGTHVPGETQIIWNWNSVSGATGYKWHTTNNYSAATDLGNTTTVTQSGLTCNTPYTIYVWAYNACGNSTVLTLTQTTSACPICDVTSVTFTYKGQVVTYGAVESSGRCWLDRNLGATAVATSSTHASSYGDLFQWGRVADGHQIRTSGTTNTLSTSNTPGHSNFIKNKNSPYDWRNPGNSNLWQGVSGINNPCPSGWRIPTEEEWTTECLSWNNQYSVGAFASPLKLPLAGERTYGDAWLYGVGNNGIYWASSAGSMYSRALSFSSNHSSVGTSYRATGLSVRCIKD